MSRTDPLPFVGEAVGVVDVVDVVEGEDEAEGVVGGEGVEEEEVMGWAPAGRESLFILRVGSLHPACPLILKNDDIFFCLFYREFSIFLFLFSFFFGLRI